MNLPTPLRSEFILPTSMDTESPMECRFGCALLSLLPDIEDPGVKDERDASSEFANCGEGLLMAAYSSS